MTFLNKNFPLLHLNTFGIKAFAPYFAEVSSYEQLKQALTEIREMKLDFTVLGGGSNTIFTGQFQGAIIKLINTKIEQTDQDIVVADAGVVWDDLVGWCVDRGLQGLENLSAIPGSVGASPVQNIGAYGVEAGDRVEWVEYLDPTTLSVELIDGTHCQFGYRHSIFKARLKGSIVLRVAYKLTPNPMASDFKLDYGDLRAEVGLLGSICAANVRAAVSKIRGEKLPDPAIMGNAGSFFKNPVVSPAKFRELESQYPSIPSYDTQAGVKIPAGWLIDKAGWKGMRQGSVGVHDKQALVIVNHGGATAKDILDFAEAIEASILDKYGIELEKEVTVV